MATPQPSSPLLHQASAAEHSFCRCCARLWGILLLHIPLCLKLCHAATGEEWRQRPKLKAVIRLFSYGFFRKIITRHDTGMGESYMDGDYEVQERHTQEQQGDLQQCHLLRSSGRRVEAQQFQRVSSSST